MKTIFRLGSLGLLSSLSWVLLLLCTGWMQACSEPNTPQPAARQLVYDFETDSEGWTVGYSDYPAGLSMEDSLVLYAMSYGHQALPASIVPAQKGIRVRGMNRSDDLFMYLSRKLEGLEPNRQYSVSFRVELASNAPANAIGAGGAPGESVYLKAGASSTMPYNVPDEIEHYRLSVDKGNQSQQGQEMHLIGNIAVRESTTDYELIVRQSPAPLTVTTSAQGALWLLVGTDSAFEGLTELYYGKIVVELVRS